MHNQSPYAGIIRIQVRGFTKNRVFRISAAKQHP